VAPFDLAAAIRELVRAGAVAHLVDPALHRILAEQDRFIEEVTRLIVGSLQPGSGRRPVPS